jgi:3-methylcrotonyl-CoA carboxylase alpha subunit
VETGYIDKHWDELFAKRPIEDEVVAQVALSCLRKDITPGKRLGPSGLAGFPVGFGPGYQHRQFSFLDASAPGGADGTHFDTKVLQTGGDTFNIVVNGRSFENVKSCDSGSNVITSFFPNTRLDTTVVREEDILIAFQRGRQYRLKIPPAKWMKRALGIKDVTNSVLAPMPCKILRVEVQEGAAVDKDQPLVVIESMKMETVIRSPHSGIISKIVHKKGVRLFFLNVIH